MSEIITIPRIHLDTNHIIYILQCRQGKYCQVASRIPAYMAISRAILHGEVKLLFSPASCLEWVEGTHDSRRIEDISSFFETSVLLEECDANLTFLSELLEETRRHFPCLALKSVSPIRAIASVPREVIELAEYHPEFKRLRGLPPVESPGIKIGVRQWLQGSAGFASRNADAMNERVQGWKFAMQSTRDSFRQNNAKFIPREAKVEWAFRQQLSEVLKSVNPDIDQNRLAELLDVDRLPACSLYVNSIWRYAKAIKDYGPDENDSDDWSQVPGIAYADFSLIEKSLRHHLILGDPEAKSRIFNDPIEFARALSLPME